MAYNGMREKNNKTRLTYDSSRSNAVGLGSEVKVNSVKNIHALINLVD